MKDAERDAFEKVFGLYYPVAQLKRDEDGNYVLLATRTLSNFWHISARHARLSPDAAPVDAVATLPKGVEETLKRGHEYLDSASGGGVVPLTDEDINYGVRWHRLNADQPSQLADSFRNGAKWATAQMMERASSATALNATATGAPPTRCCDRPPAGWHCTRPRGHQGPCAAYLTDSDYDGDRP